MGSVRSVYDQCRANGCPEDVGTKARVLRNSMWGCTVIQRDRPEQPSEPPYASFANTLARVLGMARRAQESEELRAALRSELEALPTKSKARLGILLNIGREAHDLTRVRTSLPVKASTPLDVLALCDAQTLSERYLERGMAAACAGKLTLDAPTPQGVESDQRPSVYERAWSRFGRELASSEPGEWSWFACYKGRSRMLDKLYVRHGKSAWWSFASGLDRPLREQTDVDRRRSKSTRGSSHGSSLESLLDQEGSPSRRALRRALTSVHARLGKVRSDPAPSAPRVQG